MKKKYIQNYIKYLSRKKSDTLLLAFVDFVLAFVVRF